MELAVFKNMKLLAQLRPANTNAVALVSNKIRQKYVVLSLSVVNTTGSAATFSVYHDSNGTTYDQTTAIYYACAIAANTTTWIEPQSGFALEPSNTGNLAVQSNTTNALTFTAYGIEV